MSKIKRYLTEQEDRLLCELKFLGDGGISPEAIEVAVKAVKAQRGIDTVVFNKSEQSIEDFMAANFGSLTVDEQGEEPVQSFLIDFI